jgi:hypothetical protein
VELGGVSDVQAAYRAAAVSFLSGYATAASVKLQVFRARPGSIFPPCGFVDRMTETIDPIGVAEYQRTPRAELMVLHGVFDSGDTVDQRDAFVDGFVDYVKVRVGEAGDNSLVAVVSIEDEPTFVPDWLKPELQRTYYGTRITLEGYVGDN